MREIYFQKLEQTTLNLIIVELIRGEIEYSHPGKGWSFSTPAPGIILNDARRIFNKGSEYDLSALQ
jgi:hypothetical protein